MKKILITSNLYKPNIGGIENSLYFISKAYIEDGFEVHLIASSINNFDSSMLCMYEEVEGIKIYRYGGNNIISRFVKGIGLYKKLLKNNNYNKIISRTHLPILMLKAAGAKDIKYILAGVSYKQNAVNDNIYSIKYIKRVIPNYAHHLMQCIAIRISGNNYVFSENMVRQVRSYLKYDGVINVVKPGVDSKKFYPPSVEQYNELRKELNYNSDDVVLIGVGRFYDVKGFEYLIKSLNYLPDNFKLLLIGDGINKKRYSDIIINSGLSFRVKIIGPVSDVSSFYKVSDIYVLSSIHETLGQTVLEALFSGLPIVAFDDSLFGVLTSTSEITSSSNRVFAKQLSEESLAFAVLDVANLLSKEYFCKETISNIAKSQYSWKKMIEAI